MFVRGHPETADTGSLSRLSPPSVSAPDLVRIYPGEGVAVSEVPSPGGQTGTSRPRAAEGLPQPTSELCPGTRVPGGLKPCFFLPPSSCLTSNRRPAWERGAGTEWPRRVSGWQRASGPGGGGVAVAWPLFTSCWTGASDCSANGFPPSGPREGIPLAWDPAARLGWASQVAVGAGRGPKRVFGVCCLGFPGTLLSLRRPLPQGFVLTGNVLLEGRGGWKTRLGGSADSWGVPLPSVRGKRREMPVRSGLEPLASRGWLVLPKTAPLGGTSGGNSADWRWHVDEHGYVFSLVLGKAVPLKERFRNDLKFPFKIKVFKCKNLVERGD